MTAKRSERHVASSRLSSKARPPRRAALGHAVDIIYRVCCLAGVGDLLDKIRAELRADRIPTAIRRHDTAALFDWLVAALSYQGISDRVAAEYMERHGRVRWRDLLRTLCLSLSPCLG